MEYRKRDKEGNLIYTQNSNGFREWWDINYENEEVHYKNDDGLEIWGSLGDYHNGELENDG